jgi:hypothetical protein
MTASLYHRRNMIPFICPSILSGSPYNDIAAWAQTDVSRILPSHFCPRTVESYCSDSTVCATHFYLAAAFASAITSLAFVISSSVAPFSCPTSSSSSSFWSASAIRFRREGKMALVSSMAACYWQYVNLFSSTCCGLPQRI